MRILSSLLIASTLAFAGCTQCERACRAQAAAYDECLRIWGQEWRDLGAQDRNDYRETCTVNWNTYLDGLDDEARSDELAQCGDLANDLIGAQGCEENRAALQQYGVTD